MRVRFVSGAALAATLVLISGCGGSSSSDQTAKFKTSYASVVAHLENSSKAIATAIQQAASKSDAQIGTTFRDMATGWQSQLSQLETLKPPSKVAADLNTLTSAATRVESDLNAIVAAAGTHSKAAAEQATASVLADLIAVKSGAEILNQKVGIK